ncbi:MAG: hypothetical protein ACREDA_08140, partial [Methylocella sp.]
PKTRSKKNTLSATDKVKNRAISSERVACENVIAISAQAFPTSCACWNLKPAALKRFKIIADRYRNRRRRFGLRFFLIAAIYNKELRAA